MRLHRLLVLVPLLSLGACRPLERPQAETTDVSENLVPLDSIPAEWGHLVAVIPRMTREGPSEWYELWLSDPDTGRITLVPVYRPELAYHPDFVYVVNRTNAEAGRASPESGP